MINLQQFVAGEINKLTRGDEVVKWIEYEMETLIPQLESAESLSDHTDNLTNIIRKAQILADTYTKSVIRRNAAEFGPRHFIGIGLISRKLHRIRDDITQARAKFSKSVKTARLVSSRQGGGGNEQSIPSYLRRCIHYFVLFPEDFEVPARRLIALWVAEGLVHSTKHDNQSVEQIAEGYLNELIHLGVVEIKRNDGSRKVKTCKIKAAKRSELLEEAKKASFLQDRDGRIRRLVDHNGDDGASFIQIDGKPRKFGLLQNYRDVTSFMSFNTREGSKPGKDIGDFLRKLISAGCFIWLHVLDLERVFRPKLPNAVGKLTALKYLGLRWTYLEKLPGTVDELLNLLVLDVKHTYISVLPKSLWRMEYLRHLYLSEAYRTRFPDPPSKVTLTALQTLWGAFVDTKTCVENGLDRLLNIRKLGLSCRTTEVPQLEAIDRWISRLKYLETLRLKSRDDNNETSDLGLTSLEGNQHLSTVYLLGKLNCAILCELPASLTDITLSGSNLQVDPMGFLGCLPNLVILRLLDRSVVQSDTLYCSSRGFPLLKVLWIWQLESLKDLVAEEGSLPCLEELEIRSCRNLEKLPDLRPRATDLKVRLTRMPPEFVQKAGSKYSKVEHVPNHNQYILTNESSSFTLQAEYLVSPCVAGYQQYSTTNNTTSGSIF